MGIHIFINIDLWIRYLSKITRKRPIFIVVGEGNKVLKEIKSQTLVSVLSDSKTVIH